MVLQAKRYTQVKTNNYMRILVLFFLIIILKTVDSQNVITYTHGCNGDCTFSYDNNCGPPKDSIIETLRIHIANKRWYSNDIQLSRQKADSIDSFIKSNYNTIKELSNEADENQRAQFVPPAPICFDYEDFKIYVNDSLIKYRLLNKEMDEHGVFLRNDGIIVFNELKKILR
jgi:hypothetical protein